MYNLIFAGGNSRGKTAKLIEAAKRCVAEGKTLKLYCFENQVEMLVKQGMPRECLISGSDARTFAPDPPKIYPWDFTAMNTAPPPDYRPLLRFRERLWETPPLRGISPFAGIDTSVGGYNSEEEKADALMMARCRLLLMLCGIGLKKIEELEASK